MTKLDEVKQEVDEIRDRLLIAEPAHFSIRDVVDAFLGALFLGVTFALKGLLVSVSLLLTNPHIIFLILSTLLILTAEIYFIGYSRVTKKSERKFCQFWIKRLFTFYLVAMITSAFLVYVFGLNNLAEISNDPRHIFNLVVIVAMPCAIGAAITDLLKKY